MRMVLYKGYQVKVDKNNPNSWIVVTDGKGGKIPNSLTGHYTTPSIAMSHIDLYLDSKTVAVK